MENCFNMYDLYYLYVLAHLCLVVGGGGEGMLLLPLNDLQHTHSLYQWQQILPTRHLATREFFFSEAEKKIVSYIMSTFILLFRFLCCFLLLLLLLFLLLFLLGFQIAQWYRLALLALDLTGGCSKLRRIVACCVRRYSWARSVNLSNRGSDYFVWRIREIRVRTRLLDPWGSQTSTRSARLPDDYWIREAARRLLDPWRSQTITGSVRRSDDYWVQTITEGSCVLSNRLALYTNTGRPWIFWRPDEFNTT